MNASVAANGQPVRGLPIRNFSLSLFSKLVSLAAHIAFVIVTARLFRKEDVAAIAVTGIITILMDVCKGFGLGTLLLKRLPQLGEGGSQESHTLLSTYLVYSLIAPVAMTLLGLAVPSRFIGSTFGVTGSTAVFHLALLTSLFTVLSNTNILVLQASQKFGQLAALTLTTAALQRLLPCMAAVWFGASLEDFLSWSALASVLGFAATCAPLAPIMRPGRFQLLPLRVFWPDSRHFFCTSLVRYGATQVDQLIVAILFPPATLAVYYMLRRLYSLGVVLIGSMIDALVPELAQQAGTDALGARIRLTEDLTGRHTGMVWYDRLVAVDGLADRLGESCMRQVWQVGEFAGFESIGETKSDSQPPDHERDNRSDRKIAPCWQLAGKAAANFGPQGTHVFSRADRVRRSA